MSRWRYSAFGLELDSDFPLWPGNAPGSEIARAEARTPPVGVTLRTGSPDAVSRLLSRDPVPVWNTALDGLDYQLQRGSAGDHAFAWADRAAFHLSPAGDLLTCGLRSPDDAGARRVLCDTVLWTVSLLRGFELLHAAAVCRAECAVAVLAPSGTGKTSLVAELVGRGASLLSDDVLALSHHRGHVVAHPGPPLMNLPLGPGRPRPEALGTPLAVLGEEAWLKTDWACSSARRLTAVCLLERSSEVRTGLTGHPAPAIALVPHTLALPGSRQRRRRRFELLSDLVAETTVMSLTAGEDAPPEALADLVEEELLTPARVRGAA